MAKVAAMSLLLGCGLVGALGAVAWLHWRRGGTRPPEWLPTAMFVPVMAVTLGTQQRFERRALLCLRLMAFGLLAWACVRAQAPAAPRTTAETALALGVDGSTSMAQRQGSQTAWARAVEEVAGQVASARSRGEAVGLFVAQPGQAAADVPFTRDGAAIEAVVRTLHPGGTSALAPAIERAQQAAERWGHPTRGVVITDNAAHAWPSGDPALAQAPVAWSVHAVVSSPAQNDAIEDLQLESFPDGSWLATIRVARYGGETGTRRLRLEMDGEVLERTRVALTPGAPARVELRMGPRVSPKGASPFALVRAGLEADGHDGLAADDVRASWKMQARSATLVALSDHARQTEDPALYVSHALSHPSQTGAPIDVQLAASPAAAARADASALMLADVGTSLAHAPEAWREAWVHAATRPVLQSLGDSAAATLGEEPPPLVIGALRDARAPVEAPARGRRLSLGDWQHPLLVGLDPLAKASLREARVYRYWQVTELPRQAQVVLRLDDGSPLLVAQEAEGAHHRRLLWTSTLSPQWTDLPLRSGFVPLMHHAAAWLFGGASQTPRHANVGQPIAWRTAAEAERRARLVGPDGCEYAVPTGALASALNITLRQTGWWRAERCVSGRWERWADHDAWVDVPTSESNLALAGTTEQDSAMPPAAWPVSPSPANPVYALLCAVALLLALDSLVAPSASPKNAARVGVVPRD